MRRTFRLLLGGNGVQAMGDASASIYGRVEGDIKQFIDSIRFQESSTERPAQYGNHRLTGC